MKGKTLLCIAMLLSVLAILPTPVLGGELATIKIEFIEIDGVPIERTTSLIGPPPGICHNFTIAVVVENVVEQTGVHGCIFNWVVALRWDPAVLSVCLDEWGYGKVTEGPFLKSLVPPGKTSFLFADPREDYIPDISCAFLMEMEACGSGDLCYVEFHVEGITTSSTDIELYGTVLKDYPGNDIPHEVFPGTFELPPPPPTPPKAIFTPETCEIVYVSEDVILDASASTDGWDTLPDPGHPCPIISYTWDIDIGNNGTIDFTLDGVTAEFHCEGTGDVAIILTVFAPDEIPETHPDYVDTDSETHVIHQITRPVGPVIDVYTEKGGEGPGRDPATGEPWPYPTGWSDAFAPQEEVTVYAKVTYNDDPVQNKPVAFEVKDETGTGVVYRTAFTDEYGIATTTFRLIWECDKTFEEKFEVWTIYASVSVSEEKVDDICKFRYGWLVQIDAIIAPSTAVKCEPFIITIDLNNIAYTDKMVCVTVVIYDDCGVPVDVEILPDWTVFADDGLTPEFTIHIPKWAYLGTGTIYVNVYTCMPQECGVPVCPEASALIILKKAD